MNNHEERQLYEALTRHNYFPNQKSAIGELPPCLSTRRFTPEIVEKIITSKQSDSQHSNRKRGYDLVEYCSTRYNNVPRILSLVHPEAHSYLCHHIHKNWESIKHIQSNAHSKIKPESHQDGRFLIMGYGCAISKFDEVHSKSFGKRFIVYSDISNCFNSIYTHSLPWALIGIDDAKNRSGPKFNGEWFNQYDYYQRNSKRGETQGIPVGPLTSNIAVELILNVVDTSLAEENFEFHRHIDDYECYCRTREEADKFILILGKELAKYKLTINLNKTKIIELPHPHDDEWIIELKSSLPKSRLTNDATSITASDAISFLNKAILLNKKTPDGSVLKYAVHTVTTAIDAGVAHSIYSLILNLAWHYPILIPFLDTLIEKASIDPVSYEGNLNEIILENAKHNRSDGMCWPLHIFRKHGVQPSKAAAIAILESGDCVSITILNSFITDNSAIISFANSIVDTNNVYEKDRYWLLLYQLYLYDCIENPYADSPLFSIMKSESVDFLPDETLSDAEDECNRIMAESIFSPYEEPIF